MYQFFSNFNASKKLYVTIVSPVCQKHALTQMEFDVIMFLFNNSSFDTAKEIVEVRQIAKSHASLAIKSLEGRGLLRKEYRDGNKRTEHLVLTPESLAIGEEGRDAQKNFETILMKGFSPEEMETMRSTMKRINENVRNYKV
ncbi:MAG: MarR family transcriptional regulator [Spirochaetales bacterium]|nr:MarR family transcriptional regulator [Candidatus Physcosoma equi]